MISIIEQQPAGASADLVAQVEEIFSPTGILSRAKNFEFRPQQQQMAVAVARALEERGGDERDGFRIVELESPRLAPLGDERRGEDEQLVLLAGGEVHGAPGAGDVPS